MLQFIDINIVVRSKSLKLNSRDRALPNVALGAPAICLGLLGSPFGARWFSLRILVFALVGALLGPFLPLGGSWGSLGPPPLGSPGVLGAASQGPHRYVFRLGQIAF